MKFSLCITVLCKKWVLSIRIPSFILILPHNKSNNLLLKRSGIFKHCSKLSCIEHTGSRGCNLPRFPHDKHTPLGVKENFKKTLSFISCQPNDMEMMPWKNPWGSPDFKSRSMTTPFWARRDQCTAGAMHFNLKVHRKASLSSAADQGLYIVEKNSPNFTLYLR